MIFHTNEEIPTDEETLYLVYRYIWDVNLHNFGEYIPLVCKWSNDFKTFSPIASYLDNFNMKNCFQWATLEKFKNKVKNHSDEYFRVFEHFKKLFNARYICKGCRKQSDCFQKCLLLPEEYAEIGKERNRFCLEYLKDTDLSAEEQDELIEIFELNIEPDLGKIKIYKD